MISIYLLKCVRDEQGRVLPVSSEGIDDQSRFVPTHSPFVPSKQTVLDNLEFNNMDTQGTEYIVMPSTYHVLLL